MAQGAMTLTDDVDSEFRLDLRVIEDSLPLAKMSCDTSDTSDPGGLKLPDGIDLEGDGVVGPGRHGSGGATRSGWPYGSPAQRSPSRSTPC